MTSEQCLNVCWMDCNSSPKKEIKIGTPINFKWPLSVHVMLVWRIDPLVLKFYARNNTIRHWPCHMKYYTLKAGSGMGDNKHYNLFYWLSHSRSEMRGTLATPQFHYTYPCCLEKSPLLARNPAFSVCVPSLQCIEAAVLFNSVYTVHYHNLHSIHKDCLWV